MAKPVILGQKADIPLGQRACGNCGHNPTGAACQESPPESAAMFVPQDDGSLRLHTQTYLKQVPPTHVCGQHRFAAELKKGGA
jgi:hypothetical protein